MNKEDTVVKNNLKCILFIKFKLKNMQFSPCERKKKEEKEWEREEEKEQQKK